MLFGALTATAASHSVLSPDKKTCLELDLRDGGRLMYRVMQSNKEVITWSSLGFTTNSGAVLAGDNSAIVGKPSFDSCNETIEWPLGENDNIVNNYNQLSLPCSSQGFDFTLLARLFDGSVAMKLLVTPKSSPTIIAKENTSYNLKENYTVYRYHFGSTYTPTSLDTMTLYSDLPTTVTNGKYFISISEAQNQTYTKAELRRSPSIKNTIETIITNDSNVYFDGNFELPWRTISITDSATGLYKFNDLGLRLSPPSESGVPKWLKPGKLVRSQLTTQAALTCIDFAAANGLQYVLYDAGWYGNVKRDDPRTVIEAIDMPKVIQHGKDKNIGIILYVEYPKLRKHLDELAPLYQSWGVAGIKFGFADGYTQDGMQWTMKAIDKFEQHNIFINIHDHYKPTGMSRKYPALLTQEGIRGNENSPDARHTTTLPFTRFLAGAADYTFCYPNSSNRYKKHLLVSMAHQLSLSVIYFSPLHSMFWYGRPLEYTNPKEIEFFKYVPTVWNETHYLDGAIGKHVSVARRSGQTWFVGNAAGLEGHKGEIFLDFLDKGKNYNATIYEDDGNEGLKIYEVRVTYAQVFKLNLAPKGGLAMIIRPVV